MSFYNTKCTLKLTLLGVSLLVLYTMYSEMFIYSGRESFQLNLTDIYNDTTDYLIHVPGCSIPDYSKTYKIKETKNLVKTCERRAINVKKKTDDVIVFTIDKSIRSYGTGKFSCCYQFVAPATVNGKLDVKVLSYSSCMPFTNGTETHLKEEVIFVTCKLIGSLKKHKSNNKVIYKDAYALVKKKNIPTKNIKDKWNILILGMDTMSRARFYSSMPKTAKYFKKHKWLDYSAYQKVGYNTFPNVIPLLTGKNVSEIYKKCSAGMDRCNDLMIWSDLKNAGYITATGEDYLRLPDTFSKYGYVSSPTDHYLRPLFLTGEKAVGNHVCTQKKSSVEHILNYILDFAKSYKNERSLGMFWTNSYSHNLENIPTLIDADIVNLFENLDMSGELKNTFVFFLSDHGIRYGKMRVPYESYYEERLPMLFMRVPEEFREMYIKEFNNMQINQKRLITPYDIYLTFQNIIGKTNITAEGCPTCLSIFNEISPYRTCGDAGVDDKWCSCHKLISINDTDSNVITSLEIAETYLQNKIKDIKTVKCQQCVVLNIKTVLRTHTYYLELKNITFYVLAFRTAPGDVAYETIISKSSDTFTLVGIDTISTYNTRGNCVVNPNHRGYCVCTSIC